MAIRKFLKRRGVLIYDHVKIPGGARLVSVAKRELRPGGPAELERKPISSPEGAAQSILRVIFSVAPSGLSNFLIQTPGLRPGYSLPPLRGWNFATETRLGHWLLRAKENDRVSY